MITLIRHGKVQLDEQRRWRTIEVRDLVACYNRSPIKPPRQKATEPHQGTVILCSDLPRSQESATLLFGRFDRSDALFREGEMPDLPAFPFAFPASLILATSRILWQLGRSDNCESFDDFRSRCETAADFLIDQHERTDAPVILVGHATLNHFLSKALRRRGWTGPRIPSTRHYAASEFQAPSALH